MTSAVKIMPPAKWASAPTGMPLMVWLPSTTWLGSAMAPASRSRPSASCTGWTLQRSSPWIATGRSFGTRTMAMPLGVRSIPAACCSSYLPIAATARRNDSALVPRSTIDGVGPYEHELAAAVDAEADPPADERVREVAQALRVIDDHTVVAQRVPPSSSTHRASRDRGLVSQAQVYPRRQ